MSFENNTCSRCASSLTDAEVARIKAKETRGGTIGVLLGMGFGLLGAGLGIYFGANA